MKKNQLKSLKQDIKSFLKKDIYFYVRSEKNFKRTLKKNMEVCKKNMEDFHEVENFQIYHDFAFRNDGIMKQTFVFLKISHCAGFSMKNFDILQKRG